jgi:4-azaleucine resistance transporter AzlC
MGERTGERLTFWGGVRDCIPTLLGYWSIGFAAGVVGATEGLNVLEVGLMSTFLYAGSAQFIVAAMVGTGSTIASIIATVFFINLRHLLLSAAVAPYFRQYSAKKNFLLGAQLTDETFGVAISRLSITAEGRDKWMLGLNITAQVNWIVATLIGAWLGMSLANPEQFGLKFALPAMFAGLVVQSLLHRKQLRQDMIVAGSAIVYFVLAFLWFPSHVAVIIAAVAAAITGMAVERWR